MDYTDIASLKQALGAEATSEDAHLTFIVSAISRAMDRMLAGAIDSDNYFMSETVTDEEIPGQINKEGRVICYPHKPSVASVTEFAYRHSPRESWKTQDVDYVTTSGAIVTAWTFDPNREKVFVKLSYSGGLWATVNDIPSDFKDAANVLGVRFYKEIKSGLGDSIGVAELGTMIYTKAWPTRVLNMLQPYKRIYPWT